MNIKFLNPEQNRAQSNSSHELILLVYWFISNKHNSKIFESLKTLQRKTVGLPLRIVGLNPFNSQEDIQQYQKNMNLDFELTYDEKRTALFYHINTFPSFIVMEKSGRILHRENGLSEDCFYELENVIIKNIQTNAALVSEKKGKIIPFENYKNNLSILFKKI
jgi:uncharacterized protein YjiK